MRDITYNVDALVARYRGALPVIITCPHGGDQQPPGVENPRTGAGQPPDCRFIIRTDRFTRTITRGVAQVLYDVFGVAPYVVFANFHRKYIDANRSPECAFEDPDAQRFYDEYHNTIRGFVDEIRVDNGGLGIMFDIHGTDVIPGDPADVYLGTLDSNAISNLLTRDPNAMSRRRSLPGLLREHCVVSPKDPGVPEKLPGDFTLEAYGSSNFDGIDAIQIEIESAVRTDEKRRNEFIEDFAYAISSLVCRYADTDTMSAYRSANFLPRLRRG